MQIIKTNAASRSLYTRIAFCVFVAVAAFYLWTEHRAHLFGALPYLLVLLCPLMHLFMHGSHRHGAGTERSNNQADEPVRGTHHHH